MWMPQDSVYFAPVVFAFTGVWLYTYIKVLGGAIPFIRNLILLIVFLLLKGDASYSALGFE